MCRLLGGEPVQVSFLSPDLSTQIAALCVGERQELARRLTFSRGAVSYAETVGVQAVLDGDTLHSSSRGGATYSALARLSEPETVEHASALINDFLYGTFKTDDSLASRVARVVGELHDNVASHARGVGFSAAQSYPKKGTFTFAIADCGVGMLRNVQKVQDCEDDLEAIRWCLKKGNTSAAPEDPMAQRLPPDVMENPYPASVPVALGESRNHHLGEGLHQLEAIVQTTGGSLSIWSGTAVFCTSPEGEFSRRTEPGWPGVALSVTVPLAPETLHGSEWPRRLEELAAKLGISRDVRPPRRHGP